MTILASVLAEGAQHVQLPFPAPIFGLIAIIVFAVLGFVTWTYRDVANRHPEKSAAYERSHGTHHEDRTGADH